MSASPAPAGLDGYNGSDTTATAELSAFRGHSTVGWTPVRYQSAFEVDEPNQEQTMAGLLATLLGISQTTLRHNGRALRSVHAKSHGLLQAELQVHAGLPPELAQGIFAQPGRWPVVMRLSTIPAEILDDAVSTPRGLAIKVIGVAGERLPGSEADVTQDFVLVNGEHFASPTVSKFLRGLKLVAATTERAPGLKKAFSALMRGAERLVELFGGASPTFKGLGGHPPTHILGETFFSQAPILFGPYMAKISVVPVSAELVTLHGKTVALRGHPNALREAVVAFFARHGAEWELRAQFCTDVRQMPIEDASVPWPHQLSPYLTVARIAAPPQSAWSMQRAALVDDGMFFTPWHGVAAHRPLGRVMRARKRAYELSAAFRAEHGGSSRVEPAGPIELPD